MGLAYAKYFGYLSLLATRCMYTHKFRALAQDGKQCCLYYVEIEPRYKITRKAHCPSVLG